MKICKICKINKEEIEFEKNRRVCKICRNERRRNPPKKLTKEEKIQKNKSYYQQYFIENKDKEEFKSKRNDYQNNRRKNNPAVRLRTNISNRIHRALKTKNFSILDFLPYTMEELVWHLEYFFEPWMNWENYGPYKLKEWDDNDSSTWKWNIDHIIPQSKLIYFDIEDENFKICWSLENLRPLSAKLNLIKGNKMNGNKLTDWARENDINYLKAYRMFKDGKLPVKAFQDAKGMIYIGDAPQSLNESEEIMNNPEVMSEFLKKSFEFTRNNSSIEDFACYVLSNFKLSAINFSKKEDVKINSATQNHYKEYLNPYNSRLKPTPNMYVFSEEETIEEKIPNGEFETIKHLPSKEETHFLEHLNSFKKEKPKPAMFIPNSMDDITVNPEELSSSIESVKGSSVASEIENSLQQHFSKEEVMSIFKDYYKNNPSFNFIASHTPPEQLGFIKYGSNAAAEEKPKKKPRGRPKKGSK